MFISLGQFVGNHNFHRAEKTSGTDSGRGAAGSSSAVIARAALAIASVSGVNASGKAIIPSLTEARAEFCTQASN